MSASKLLMHLAHLWINGPPSLSSVQREKGEKILQALGKKAAHSNVPWLTWKNTQSSTCVVLGSAKLVREGEEPSTLLLLRDFQGASAPIMFGDSLTGRFFEDVEWPDFLDQRDRLGKGRRLKNSESIFSAIDIPSTDKGFARCRYSLALFEGKKDCTVAPLSTAWTLPGYITLPHMDDPITGLYTIHWKGGKLWVLWPATQENMKKMEDIRLHMPNLDATLSLIETLEGLEFMFLTQDEYMEFSFYLLPNTIHACLSFTECCHSGSYVRSFEFISQVQSIIDWELEWINMTMDPILFADCDLKERIVQDFVNAMWDWEQVEKNKGIHANKRRIIQEMICRGREGIKKQALLYKISLT
ncbi:hypothetical protein EST38_g14200 [Candolleomyces aberdarensis]|uniref:JmjC domain-containing protein n=1 Tax=Candolleomyces aberdarensis TaxID=2316362 RepID=A0A4Q2D0L5_9AGAR|nr:hypothetical protein EST38_g14200 [Candolleomyces aberdarensis]